MGNQILSLCPTEFFADEGFDNIYEIDEANPIGTGKFAVVHMVWRRRQPEKRYALKVINTKMGDTASLARIKEEVSILQVLGNHPGMVSLVDVDETLPGSIRLVLELCEGGELYDRIQQKQFYLENEAKVLVANLLDAVAYIHGKGIMHRDLKPENILLASKVSHTDIKISDFGLAKISRDYPRRLPRSNSICGSDFYLAPEVIKQEEYGREIDVWAIGVITYVIFSGSLPFFHNVLHKLYRQIVERDLSFPEQAWKNVSKGALDFILRLLQVRAGDRLTADQALGHPWLRGTGRDSSFNSSDLSGSMTRASSNSQNHFGLGSYGNPQLYNGLQPQSNHSHDGQRSSSPPAGSRPLEHAHNINTGSNDHGSRGGEYGRPPPPPPPYGGGHPPY